MERVLRDIFDYQRFSPNDRLESLIEDTRHRYGACIMLSDDDMELLNAAGEPDKRYDRERNKHDIL